MSLTVYDVIEAIGAASSIAYSLLLMREKSIGWLFGIISSLLGVILFFKTGIYAQALISVYYAAIGVYGWVYWRKAEKRDEHIHKWRFVYHLYAILLFTVLSIGSAWFFQSYTDSKQPVLDSFVTVFGILASLKEARKILTSWAYWFIINVFSALLYYQQALFVYAVMMLVYAAICIPGYLNWLRIYKTHEGRPEH